MTVYFKLNNWAQPGLAAGAVAYYPVAPAGGPTHRPLQDWIDKPCALIGQMMFVHSNNNGANFNAPQPGDDLIIYQHVCGQVQVVTHVLTILDGMAQNIAAIQNINQMGLDASFLAAWANWPFIRMCRIRAILNPNSFGARVSPKYFDLMSDLNINPVPNFISINDLLRPGPFVPNGLIYHNFANRGPIAPAALNAALNANPHYIKPTPPNPRVRWCWVLRRALSPPCVACSLREATLGGAWALLFCSGGAVC